MPAQPLPQTSASESPGEPAEPPAGAPPSGLHAAAATSGQEGTLFHLLLQRGWDAELAYTANQRIHAMTSETVAAGLQPVLAELRQMRESMATKVDLEKLETNLRREMAEREVRLVKWVFGALLAQAALVVGLVTLLK